MSGISLCMIVRDEASRLAACLGSARRAVDEAVVVDTGSTDDTRDIARAHGARVFEWAWRDDFAAARNEALARTRGEWVLVLDADERLAPGAPERVRAAAAETAAHDGFDCLVVSALPAGQPAPEVASWLCRLFRRRPHVAFEGRVHEQVAPSIRRAGGSIARAEITIAHEGYADPSPAKLARNLALLERQLADAPGDPFARLNLGLTLQSAGRWSEATPALERALASTDGALSAHLRAVGLTHLAQGHLHDGRLAAAATAAERALALDPMLALARYVKGRACFAQGRLDAAADAFDALRGRGPDTLGMALHPHVLGTALALCHLRRRRFAEATELLEPVAADDATGEAAFHLGNALLGLGRLGAARAAYRDARGRGFSLPDLGRRLDLCERLLGHDDAVLAAGGLRA
jgi:tetratricopeptide (TPR) repeat protein